MEFNPQVRTPPLGNLSKSGLLTMEERRARRVARESNKAVDEISRHLGEFRLERFRSIDGRVYEVDAKPSVGVESGRDPWTIQFVNGGVVNIAVPFCTFQRIDGQPQPKIKINDVEVSYTNPLLNELEVPRADSRIYLKCTVDDTSIQGLNTTLVEIVALNFNEASQLVNEPTKRYIPIIDLNSDTRRVSSPHLSRGVYTTRWGDRRRIDNMLFYPL